MITFVWLLARFLEPFLRVAAIVALLLVVDLALGLGYTSQFMNMISNWFGNHLIDQIPYV